MTVRPQPLQRYKIEVVHIVKKRSGKHVKPPHKKLKTLVGILVKAKVFVKHSEGRAGTPGHPLVPRRYEWWVNDIKFKGRYNKHRYNVGMYTRKE